MRFRVMIMTLSILTTIAAMPVHAKAAVGPQQPRVLTAADMNAVERIYPSTVSESRLAKVYTSKMRLHHQRAVLRRARRAAAAARHRSQVRAWLRYLAQQQKAAASPSHAHVTHAARVSGAGYVCPISALGAFGRVDEGVDFAGSGAVTALGPGIVTYASGASSWPGGGFVVYKLTGGPHAGQYIYVAENISVSVGVGQHVSPGTVVASAYGGAFGIETGWAMPPGNVDEAAAYNHYTDGVPTSEGYDFQSLLRGLGC